MFSWTIEGKEYTAPMGYGEISIAEFTAYMATVAPSRPETEPMIINGSGWKARLARRIRRKVDELKTNREQESFDWLKQQEYEASFVQHWLKLPAELKKFRFFPQALLHKLSIFPA